VGGGANKMATQAILPPPQKWRIQDLSHKKVVKSGGFGSNPRVYHVVVDPKVTDGPYVAVT
jgi:hypothetical protein